MIRATVRISEPERWRVALVTDVVRSFEPGFYCGYDAQSGRLVKFHRDDVVKTERVNEDGNVVETTAP